MALIKFTKDEFEIIKTALADGLEAVTNYYYEEVKVYINPETSEIVENPSEEEKKNLKLVADPQRTIRNAKIMYDSRKLTPEMLEAGRIVSQKSNG